MVDYESLVEMLRSRAGELPDKVVYTFLREGREVANTLTFSQLEQQAQMIGALLQSFGSKGERVLLLYPQGLDYMAAFFGCLYAGMIAVPAYPPRQYRNLDRLRSIIDDAQPLVVLTTSALLETIREQMPDLEELHWVATDTLPLELSKRWIDPQVEEAEIAFLQYTSGSTSNPKGVMVSHRNLLHNQDIILKSSGHEFYQSTLVTWLPLFHDMGLISQAIHAVYLGSHCVMMDPVDFMFHPERWLEAITAYGGHTTAAPNFAYDLCVRKISEEQLKNFDLKTLNFSINGAEPVRQETMLRFQEKFQACGLRPLTLRPGYGLAEGTLYVTIGAPQTEHVYLTADEEALKHDQVVVVEPGSARSRVLVGCGKAVGDQTLCIVNPQTTDVCAPLVVGEIWLQGDSVCQGYWQREEATRGTFQARTASGDGPFLRTGDLGFLNEEGELFVTGRIKDLIVIRGQNHYPQDIEFTVQDTHALIRPGCIAAFSIDQEEEEKLVIVAELGKWAPAGNADPTVAALQIVEELSTKLRLAVTEEHQLQVHDIVLIKTGSIHKTSSGKIQRHATKLAYLNGTLEHWGV